MRIMNRRIIIIGFMACGKTTVAKELAQQLDCDYVDLDSFITEGHGRSPAEIIQQDGEEQFRELETLALRDVLQNKGARVIALGGGTWTIPANRTLAALHECETVWLDVPFEVCWNRIVAGATARPLAPDRETAWSRYESRRAGYGLSSRRVAATEADSVQDIAEQIGREL